jgi:hypothetical protein
MSRSERSDDGLFLSALYSATLNFEHNWHSRGSYPPSKSFNNAPLKKIAGMLPFANLSGNPIKR